MIPSQALIGAPLAKLQEDFKLVPLDVLKGYVNDTSVDPSSGFIRTVVAAELARRKRVQDESNAASQPNPANRPTVAQELAGIPAAQPAQSAPSDQPANFAHGGIIALNGEEGSYLKRQYPKEMAERNILADLFSGVGPTLKDFVQGLEGFKGYEARRAEARDEPKAKPSETLFPESGTELAPIPATPTAAVSPKPNITANRVSTRPTATPAAPAAPTQDAGLTNFNTQMDALMQQVLAPTPSLTTAQADAARKAAEDRLKGVQDPYMKAIADLQAKQAQIGESRGGDPFGRAMMQLGLGMMKGIGRPGTGINALGEAGLGALASYEKEELGKIDRATKVNQLQIEMQKALMQQGVDRVTAGNLAEKEARNIVEERAKESRAAGTSAANILTNKQTLNERTAHHLAQLENAQLRLQNLIQTRASQDEINRARLQTMLLERELKQMAASTLSPKDRMDLEKLVGESWGNVSKEYYAQLPGGQKIVADLAAGRVKESDLPADIRNTAKDLYRQSLVGGTSRANVFTPSSEDVLKKLRG